MLTGTAHTEHTSPGPVTGFSPGPLCLSVSHSSPATASCWLNICLHCAHCPGNTTRLTDNNKREAHTEYCPSLMLPGDLTNYKQSYQTFWTLITRGGVTQCWSWQMRRTVRSHLDTRVMATWILDIPNTSWEPITSTVCNDIH